MSIKCLLILLDGLGDRSYPSLDNRTPLQAAFTPNLDHLAALGANGLYHASRQGLALPGESAHFAMFGYGMEEFPGRGALEALGAGVALAPGDVAILAHFVSVRRANRCLVLQKQNPKLKGQEAEELFRAVGELEYLGVQFCFSQTRGAKGILRLRGRISPHITDSDPMQAGRALMAIRAWQQHAGDPDTVHTADALNGYLQWVYELLSGHSVNQARQRAGEPPVNMVVTQRAGRLKSVQPFFQRYGLHGLSIAGGIVYQGLATFLGLDQRKVNDAPDAGADIAQKLELARKALDSYDFVHVHSKAPDEAGRTKNPLAKKAAIEALDAGIGTKINELLADPELLIVVTADHCTPSAGPLIHSGETVPLLLCGPGLRRDAVVHFDEVSACAGALGSVRGRELMYLVLNHLDRAKLQGIMDTPVDQPYWPGGYEPFCIDRRKR